MKIYYDRLSEQHILPNKYDYMFIKESPKRYSELKYKQYNCENKHYIVTEVRGDNIIVLGGETKSETIKNRRTNKTYKVNTVLKEKNYHIINIHLYEDYDIQIGDTLEEI